MSSWTIDNIAYITRDGTIASIRKDHDRFLQVLAPKLDRFDVDSGRIQHFATHDGLEV